MAQRTSELTCGRGYWNQHQKFENLDMIGWFDAGKNVKASIT